MAINELRVGSKGVDWIHLAQDVGQNQVVVSTVKKLWVSYKAGNFLTDERVLGLLRRTPLKRFLTMIQEEYCVLYTLFLDFLLHCFIRVGYKPVVAVNTNMIRNDE
jgi:hypothetical protein